MDPKSNESINVTDLLNDCAAGDSNAQEELFHVIYDDLRKAASRVLSQSYRGDFQTTALVNESMLRFQNPEVLKKYSKNRRVFFSVAIRAMQQIMINHYRQRKRELTKLTTSKNPFDIAIKKVEQKFGASFEMLHGALEELRGSNARRYAAIVHRFFGGLNVTETAELLDVSNATVERDCRLARAWLLMRLKEGKDPQ